MKKGSKMTLEQKKRLSEAHKGQVPWNKGKTEIYSEESKRKISEANKGNTTWLGKHHTEESKRKMSLAHKGKHSSPKTEFKKGMIPWNKGKSPSKESIEKRRKTMKERYYSNPEARLKFKKKMSNAQKKVWANPEYKKQRSEDMKKK